MLRIGGAVEQQISRTRLQKNLFLHRPTQKSYPILKTKSKTT